MDGGRWTGEKQHVHRGGRPAVQLDYRFQRVFRRPERSAASGGHVPGRQRQLIRKGYNVPRDQYIMWVYVLYAYDI